MVPFTILIGTRAGPRWGELINYHPPCLVFRPGSSIFA